MGKQIIFFVIFLVFLGFLYVVSHPAPPPTASPFTTPTPDLSQMAAPLSTIQPLGGQQGTNQQAQQQLQQALEEIKTASITATIKTAKGDITLELYGKDAPITVYNFVQKAQSGFYTSKKLHRVEEWVIQGGDPNGDGTGGGNIPVEFNQRPFVTGSLGQASRGDGQVQNDSQFFITKSDASWLDGKYTNYGMVTSGMDVVEKIEIGDTIQSVTVESNTP